MNLYIKILLGFLPFSLIQSQDCKSKLMIESDLIPINIFINDSLVSEEQTYQTELADGFYKIVVMENVDRWDAKTFIDSIDLKNCEVKKLVYKSERKAENKIYLDSSPQDAYVFENDSLLGNTPLFIGNFSNELKLTKPGYEDKIISNNQFIENNLVSLKFIGDKKEESFFYSTEFQILAGSALVLGGLSAYYKLKADDAFDDYQFTGDKAMLDKTNDFDVVSGVTFTALQINFGYILYRFLTE
ncbi:MAG: hypothetical protein IPH97_11215 [Ignavibacteriales bacterium]|nr:hypothetical protein [Ignavibacteriales bacterium]